MTTYVVARSAKSKRPMCQHVVVGLRSGLITTLCGHIITGGSSEFTDLALNSIMCQRCKKKEEKA